jgi:hypothetical protein
LVVRLIAQHEHTVAEIMKIAGVCRQTVFTYRDTEGVTTGPGNSGGPVLVEEGGDWKLAGILISGSYTGIGIYTLNSASEAAAADVLGLSLDGVSRTVYMRKAVKLKDASRKYGSPHNLV